MWRNFAKSGHTGDSHNVGQVGSIGGLSLVWCSTMDFLFVQKYVIVEVVVVVVVM